MSESNFRKGLRSAVRGLWSGAISELQFEEVMQSVIHRNLTKAWNEGAIDCGITSDELSESEIEARENFIINQYSFISGFSSAIDKTEKKLSDLYNRVGLWVERYPEAKANGKAMACADQKTKFMLGPTKEHCLTCLGLNTRVYRNSTWVKYNAVPPHNWRFACRGGCRCNLVPSSEPITKGRFPVGLLR